MAQTIEKLKGTIQTDFHGLIQILAKNLYPQVDMFIRELIQNAHDSIVKRQAVANAPSGTIDIIADRATKTIIFRDNGAGMTEREIVDYLATIGRSGTGELRHQLEERDRARAQSLIGQFGIGFLSAFVAAERLVVDTRSATPGQTALRWEIAGGPDYELSSGARAEVGTDIILHLKSESLGITNTDALRKAVRKYADFIPFPISINNQGPVNTMHAPWHLSYGSDSERRKAYKRWVEERFPDIALEIIPVDIEVPFVAKGVMYISDRRLTDVNMPGMVDIYQARMFIKQSDRNLLPSWAKFIRGVIDSPALTPTAARDAVQEDRAHTAIKTALGHLIIDALQRMSREDPKRFHRLMEWHHYTIKGIAVEFEDFFNAIADNVLFESNIQDKEGSFMGVTISEYCQLQNAVDDLGRKVVYYISTQGASTQFYRLCKAKNLLALNAGLIFDEEFLKKYAARHTDKIALRRLDIAEGTAIFETLSDEERSPFLDTEYRLRMLFRRTLPTQETLVQTERFSPAEMPCVVTQSEDVEIAQQLERLTGPLGLISTGLSAALNEVLGIHKRLQRPAVLHLNATSYLINRLMREDFNDPFIQDAWMTLYNNAAMYGQHVLTVENLEVLHDQTLRWLDKILEMREQNRQVTTNILK